MAVFGDLADLPFVEILNVIDRRSGRLLIFGLPDPGSFELDLVDGTLRGLRVDGEDVEDPLCARDGLIGLMRAPRGVFEFHRALPGELRGALDVPLPLLPLMILAAATGPRHGLHSCPGGDSFD
ncbi:MAG TPA: DUF4388 domain-containing protein [Thermoanaerobaculia bacterium]|nr:DUF4388 domain-containing protein [Thermoanaerobaculia bacterium]